MGKRKSGVAPAPSTPVPKKSGLPPKFLAISIAATVNFTAGMVGWAFPEQVPALGRPAIVAMLIALGIGLEIWAIRLLFAARRAEIEAARRR